MDKNRNEHMTENIYRKLWHEEEERKEQEIQEQVVKNLPKGKPRQGISGERLRRIKK